MMDFFYEHAPSIGLVFFFTFFLWVAYRTYRPAAKQQMQDHAFIPLKEENHHD